MAPRKPRNPPGPAKEKIGSNSNKAKDLGSKELTESEKRELFLKDVADYEKVLATKKTADAAVKNMGKRIKADGFTLAQVKVAIEMNEPEGEDKVRQQVADTMQAARWVGSDIGSQLEMFNEPNRTPIEDRAYGEGEKASMENKPAKPPYDPHTSAYRAWMKGYGAHQATLAEKIGRGNGAAEAQQADA